MMCTRKTNDKDIFYNVIDIGLRMYGNGYPYPAHTVDYVMEYCRQQIRYHFLQHNQLALLNSTTSRMSLLNTLIYRSRHRRSRLKRLQQFVQAKDRSTLQQDECISDVINDKKSTISHRFSRICRQIHICMDDNENRSMAPTLDRQRLRQYARLDAYYNNDTLTSGDYLSFVEQQHSFFNHLRSLSTVDIAYWLQLDNFSVSKQSSSNQDLRLAEICVFLVKEILLSLMDKVCKSDSLCEIRDVFRRQHVYRSRRFPFSGRKRQII